MELKFKGIYQNNWNDQNIGLVGCLIYIHAHDINHHKLTLLW